MDGILALSIPLFFVIGLFVTISLNVYFKSRTKEALSRNVSAADLGEWFKYEAAARTQRSRNAVFRTAGFLAGAGIGTAIGCFLMPVMEDTFVANSWVNEVAYFTFLIIAIALFFGGMGMIGSYFVQKVVEKNG